MGSRIKILGLACALLALQAVAATTSQATPEYTASSYPSITTGSNTKGSSAFTTEGGKAECDTHGVSHAVSAATTTATVTLKYTNCAAFGFAEATMNVEGCVYISHATETVSSGVYKHHVDISCPAGQSIKVTASTCKLEIKGQNGLTTVQTANLKDGTVTVQPSITGIAYTVTQDGFLCPFNGTGNKTGATYTGDMIVARVGGGIISVSGE